ncbi:MAG: site-specific DNA-methyltransferase [Candidatus Nanoarchaeia archaeon]
MEFNQVYCGNCIDLLKQLPDKSIDVCLTDFPYGVGVDYGGYFVDTRGNLKELISKVMPELQRVCKRIVLTCGQSNVWMYPEADWIMAWINTAGANQNKWGFTCWQPILCYGKDAYREANKGARPDIIMENACSDNVAHPCPKPVKFWRKLLQRVSVSETDIILDPFAGSGVTLLVAKQLNRKFIGFEINPEYVKIANERLKQSTLFDLFHPLDVKQEGGDGLPSTDKSVGIRPTIL